MCLSLEWSYPVLVDNLICPGLSGVGFPKSSGVQRGGSNAQQVSRRCSQAGRGARESGHEGLSACRDLRRQRGIDLSLAQAGAHRPRRGAKAEHRGADGASRPRSDAYASSRRNWLSGGRSTRSSSSKTSPQEPLPGDLVPDRAGVRRAEGMSGAGCLSRRLLRLEDQAAVRADAQACSARRRDCTGPQGLRWHLRVAARHR